MKKTMPATEWSFGTIPKTKNERTLMEMAKKAFENHKSIYKAWPFGEPVKAWFYGDYDGTVCVEYANNEWIHYQPLDGVMRVA